VFESSALKTSHLNKKSLKLNLFFWQANKICYYTSPNSENSVKISGDRHLFVQLWRLCQICGCLEVAHFEHVGTTFGRSWNTKIETTQSTASNFMFGMRN